MITRSSLFGIQDGGGNLGVGINAMGPHCQVDLGSTDTVSGVSGYVSMDGELKTYDEIVSGGPFLGAYGSFVRKI